MIFSIVAGSIWFCFLFLDWIFLQLRFQICCYLWGPKRSGPWILPNQWDTQKIYLWWFFNDLFICFVVFSRFADRYERYPYLSQESIVLSRLQLAYLYYLEISTAVLQNYRMTAFVNLRLTPLERQNLKKVNIISAIQSHLF